MNSYVHNIFIFLLMLTAFCNCQHEEDFVIPEDQFGKLELLLQKEDLKNNRNIGDPGIIPDESTTWDTIQLIIVYDNSTPPIDGKWCRVHTLPKSEFNRLPQVDATNPNIRKLNISLPMGQIYLYGAVYYSKASGAKQLTDAINGCNTLPKSNAKKQVENLPISNDYSKRLNEFLSVGTGFYHIDANGINSATPTLLTIRQGLLPTPQLPRLILNRLAAKIDVQWDAEDAYLNATQQYNNVRVNRIIFNAQSPSTNNGAGKLFPTLNATNDRTLTPQPFAIQKISQRNGRTDLYVFPDGATPLAVTLSISAQDANSQFLSKDYTITPEREIVQQGIWYKINAKIKGLTGSSQIQTGNGI